MASGTQAMARVVHAMPGRVRLRFRADVDVGIVAQRMREALAELVGGLAVEPRPASRSVLIRYDHRQAELRRLLDECLPAGAVEPVETGAREPGAVAGETSVGRSVVGSVSAINAGIGRITGGFLDLRDVFPLTLLAFGLRRVAQGNLQPMPWYNLLYYGYSTFAALHGRRAVAEPSAREILRRRYARGELTRAQYRQMMAELEWQRE